jgi:hypothetical protein
MLGTPLPFRDMHYGRSNGNVSLNLKKSICEGTEDTKGEKGNLLANIARRFPFSPLL